MFRERNFVVCCKIFSADARPAQKLEVSNFDTLLMKYGKPNC
jgi:hypothetical protein